MLQTTMNVVGPNEVIDLATLNCDAILHHMTYYDIIPKIGAHYFFATYYAQNYSSIIYTGLHMCEYTYTNQHTHTHKIFKFVNTN